MKPAIRLISFAWGEAYVDRLLEFCLASVMAPGNLPALAKSFDCTVVVLTEQRLFARISEHPMAVRIQAIATLRLLALDDLITEPWQYGITLAYALFRGLTDLGPAMTETYSLFLNADFVLADGCYERLITRILAGEHAHLAPSYCAVEEDVRPILEARAKEGGGVLAVPPRALAEIILRHRHNTIRAKTVNQQAVHFAHADQFYWAVDSHTLLGHQMPISLIGMRPEVQLTNLEAFWDWGVVYDFCPSKDLKPLGDSDEFLMLEMRREVEHIDLVRLGKATPSELAGGMSSYITQYQLDNAKFPLTLHDGDLAANLDADHARLRAFIDAVFAELSPQPISHRRHAQWIYHTYHFERTRQIHRERTEITRQIESLERDARRARGGARALGPEHATVVLRLRSQLERINSAHERDRSKNEAFVAFLMRETSLAARETATDPAAALQRSCDRIFGVFPKERPWSPYALANAPTVRGLRLLQQQAPQHVLAICRDDSAFAQCLKTLPGSHAQTPAAAVLTLGLEGIAPDIPLFDLCVVTVRDDEFPYLSMIFERVFARLRPGGMLRLYWTNTSGFPPDTWQVALREPAMLASATDVAIAFYGSQKAATAMKIYNWALARRASRIRQAIILALGLTLASAFALLAKLQGLREADAFGNLPSPCVALTITLRKHGRSDL